MARYDKYDPVDGGFRAPLAADYAGSETPVGVALDANGRVVVGGAGTTGILGIMCQPNAKKAGEVVDVMTHGELVEFAGAAGTVYWSSVTGVIGTTAPGAGVNFMRVGHTVEATRLIVRCQISQG